MAIFVSFGSFCLLLDAILSFQSAPKIPKINKVKFFFRTMYFANLASVNTLTIILTISTKLQPFKDKRANMKLVLNVEEQCMKRKKWYPETACIIGHA